MAWSTEVEDLGSHVAALFGPLVGLFHEHGTDEANDRAAVREDPDHVGPAPDLAT